MQGKAYELVNQLALLLRKNGDRILNGESKLSLTTQSLSLLNVSFRRYSDAKNNEPSRNRSHRDQMEKWKFNVQYLHDFITKTISLKITHSTATMQGPILISRFRSVEILELKKVPIHMLEGLHRLRGQIKIIIVSRCLNSLQDLLEACGGDQSSPMSWPCLKSMFLSYNGLKKLDSSLRLLPVLEIIDLSHNDLERTENYLEHLTDITRVNLGFNRLDSIPSFSLTTKSRIKTLVLRNNNLDNIEGIDDLNSLEELDLSENCLCDHSCLVGLAELNKLTMLSLQGNPLSFHDSHRPLTVQYISIASGNNLAFTLDGKKITATERLLTQRSVLNLSRRPSWESQSSTINGTRQREVISSSYTFDESDDIATNLRIGSPGRSRKKRKARPKTALISDEEVIESSMNEYSSRESSRAPSPEKEDEPDTAQSTKEEIQMIRDHYGVNWLQVIAAKKEDTLASSSSSREVDKTEDDIYLNESVANLTVSSSHKETQDYTEVTNKDTEDDIEVLPEPTVNEEDTVQMRHKAKVHSFYSIYRDTSLQGSEWNRISEAEEPEYYGAESEPFIVMLPSEKLQQLIISVNNRYLIEKDLNGQIVELLDLKCIVSFLISMETVDHENISGEISLPVCKIKFDYTRKDRRDRKYVMEDADIAKEFQNLLQPFIDAKDVKRQMKDLLQCLKCSNQFDKSDAEIKIHVPDKKHFNSFSNVSKGDSMKYICPKCKSEMVVELDTKELPTSLQNTPVGSLISGDNFIGTPSKGVINGIISGSPVAKSSPKKEKENKTIGFDDLDGTTITERNTVQLRTKTKEQSFHNVKRNRSFQLPEWQGISDAEENVQLRPKTEGHDLYRNNREKIFQDFEQKGISDTDESEYNGNKDPSAVMSNSAMISRTQKETVIQKSYSTGTTMCDMDKLQADENPEYIKNSSWLGVTKSNSRQVGKRSSIDSDITILTNDSSSIAVISESTNESSSIAIISESSNDMIADRTHDGFSDNSEAKTVHNLTLPVRKAGLNSSQNCEIDIVSRKLTGISEEAAVVTPMGSPLSSSICSSMVSSVYENTVTSPSTENLHQETVDSYKNCDNGFHDNHNGNEESIYDVFVTNDNKEFNSMHTNGEIDNRESSLTVEVLNSSETTTVDNSNLDYDSGDVSMDADSVLKSFCDTDFTNIDHRLKLFLTMTYLEENETEKVQCALKVDIVQYMETEEFTGYVVVSTDRIFIFKFIDKEDSDDYESCLKCIENQPITELQYIDIGLGYQSLRFEFSTECSSFTFLIRDEGRCKHFINLVTSIVQDTAFSENSKLQGISKYNAATMENLKSAIAESDEDEDGQFNLVRYLCGILVEEEDIRVSVGLTITEQELILVTENYQWPLPRLQAPLDAEVKGQQFTIRDCQKINNIATVETCENDTTQIRLTFFHEESQQEVSWHIAMTTDSAVLSLVNAIREPWENEFGVDLDVTPVSFLSNSL
ncbi:serine/threonine-protein kinase 11-interacting protein-like isoform X2 [Mytilus californianus]|uniref:serine/threonine-protein kinase 11-interacting protein-like isoform X2 n=1 Tax=Mytilus californianus TaxID=6549 RepID=UPI0022459768|nr:serine/threonine-protein kinase 11-interacting protein-like isoform X2 [Mytilus californianus]